MDAYVWRDVGSASLAFRAEQIWERHNVSLCPFVGATNGVLYDDLRGRPRMQVYHNEVTARLRERRLDTDRDFEWVKVLRFYLEVSLCAAHVLCSGVLWTWSSGS